MSDFPAKLEFAKLSLKVPSPQPSWPAVTQQHLEQLLCHVVASLASPKLLFSVLETMRGLFCFVRCSVFRFYQPNYQNVLGKLIVVTNLVSKADCSRTCSWQVAVLG